MEWISLREAQRLLRKNGRKPDRSVLLRWVREGKLTARRGANGQLEFLKASVEQMRGQP